MAEPQFSKITQASTSIGFQILGTKGVGLAFFALHVYDHILTLPDEVAYMWNRKTSPVSILFFMNRYYSLVFFSICIFMGIFPLTDPEMWACKHFILFLPIAGGIILTVILDLILVIRVSALYALSKRIAIFLLLYLAAELGVELWVCLTPGHHPLQLPLIYQNDARFNLCMEENSDNLSLMKQASFQIMQVVYDTIVIALTLFKTWKLYRDFSGRLVKIIALDSFKYYIVAFSANLTWALMILYGPDTLRYTAACPTLILACTMISRLTLSLRAYVTESLEILSREDEENAQSIINTIIFPRRAEDLENQRTSFEETLSSNSEVCSFEESFY